jgi:hypothetical protein
MLGTLKPPVEWGRACCRRTTLVVLLTVSMPLDRGSLESDMRMGGTPVFDLLHDPRNRSDQA